jgi:hypothetical protein
LAIVVLVYLAIYLALRGCRRALSSLRN